MADGGIRELERQAVSEEKKRKRKPRKTRCVICKKRMYLAYGEEGAKAARKTCDKCRGIDGYACAGSP